MPRIRRLSIKNFRSIHSIDCAVEDLTVLVGDNDCGKSNILRALNLFFRNETNPGEPFNFRNDYNRFAEPGARQAKEITIEIDLELPVGYHATNGEFVRWRKRWRVDGLQDEREYKGYKKEPRRRGSGTKDVIFADPIPERSNVHTLLRKIEFEYVPAVRSPQFFRQLRGRIYRVISEVAEENMRATSGDFENAIRGHVEDLLTDISNRLGDDATMSLPNDLSSIFERLDFLYGEGAISLDSRGDGIKARYIPLILKFIADQKRQLQTQGLPPHSFIWAYEEPENNLEFRRAQELADIFCDLAADDLTQILLTTHSPIFYNLSNKSEDGRKALHINRLDSATGTKATESFADGFDLDQKMGVMPIIAPHVAQAQRDLDTAVKEAEYLKAQLEEHNAENLPTIFIEGQTEFELYDQLLNRFLPQYADRLFLAEPPQRAGANYVANMLRAWEYANRHRPPMERQKAFGVVDADEEGHGAINRFQKEIRNPSLSALVSLNVPAHLQEAAERGLRIPICLEHLWPHEIWREARDQGWLEQRGAFDAIPEEIARQLVDEQEQLTNLVPENELLYVQNWPAAAHKMEWLRHVLAMPDNELVEFAQAHLSVLRSAITFLTGEDV